MKQFIVALTISVISFAIGWVSSGPSKLDYAQLSANCISQVELDHKYERQLEKELSKKWTE